MFKIIKMRNGFGDEKFLAKYVLNGVEGISFGLFNSVEEAENEIKDFKSGKNEYKELEIVKEIE